MDNNFSVAYAACGIEYLALARMSILSLGIRGNWFGEVFVMTNLPKQAQMILPQVEIVPVHLNASLRRPLRFKELKAHAVKYSKTDVVFFLDCDVIIGYPVGRLFEKAKSMAETCEMVAFKREFDWWHTGAFCCHKKTSGDLMDDWIKQIHKPGQSGDERALWQIHDKHNIQSLGVCENGPDMTVVTERNKDKVPPANFVHYGSGFRHLIENDIGGFKQ